MRPRALLSVALLVACAAGAAADSRRSLRAVVKSQANLAAAAKALGVGEAAVRKFAAGLEGAIFFKGDSKYPAAVDYTEPIAQVYNKKRPSIVVQAVSEADVRATVAFAAAHRAPLCVRAGGHDTAGASLCAGILLELEKMNKIVVDKARLQFVAQAGTRFQKIFDTLEPMGLSAVTGDCETVGLAGFSMGGGWGWLSKQHGLGLDNVLAYRVVLANGTVVDATAANEPDLFWALRGAGHGNFGVVTSIKYRALQGNQRSNVWSHTATFEMKSDAQAQQAARAMALWSGKYVGGASSRLLTVQPNIIVDRLTGVKRLWLNTVYFGREAGAKARLAALVAPIVALGPSKSVFSKIKFANLASQEPDDFGYDSAVNAGFDADKLWSVKRGEYAAAPLGVAGWRTLIDGVRGLPKYPPNYKANQPGTTITYFEAYEGAITDVPADATAFVHRARGFTVVTDHSFMPAPGVRDAALAWLAKLYDQQWKGVLSGGAYQNYPSPTYTPAEALRKYYGANLCRLVRLKARYDPKNVFAAQLQGLPTRLAGC